MASNFMPSGEVLRNTEAGKPGPSNSDIRGPYMLFRSTDKAMVRSGPSTLPRLQSSMVCALLTHDMLHQPDQICIDEISSWLAGGYKLDRGLAPTQLFAR